QDGSHEEGQVHHRSTGPLLDPRKAEPHRLPRRGWQEGSHRREDRGGAGLMSDTATTTPTGERPRLKQRYDGEIRTALKTQLGLANVMQVPRFQKIVVNMGVGRAT